MNERLRTPRILISLLVFGLIVAGASYFSAQFYNQAHTSQNALEASYQNNFFNLIENLENLDVLLGKTLASNSKHHNTITLVTVWSMAEAARTNLSNLPLGIINTARSNQYLSQLGDFSYSLAKKTADGQEISENEWKKIKQLHRENRTIHNQLRDLTGMMQEKNIRFGSLSQVKKARLPEESQAVLDGFGKLDERLQDEVPTLTYDGPFSDHVVNRSPLGLTGPAVDKKQAEIIAREFMKKINQNTDYRVTNTGLADGRISSYSITLQPDDGGKDDIILGISRKGGHVVLMMNGAEPAAIRKVTLARAVSNAEKFVEKLELGEFIATGHLAEGNELLVNFAGQQDGIVLYPDMIQVSISLQTGNVAGYDASKYLLSHIERKLAAPVLTEAEARAGANPHLEIERVRLALIPLDNLEEKLTYEIKGKIEGDTYFVYINAQTGTQEKILLIVETPEGSRSI